MTLSETDLELLNAFHDGELDAPGAARIRERLEDEPELRQALAGIEEVSAALRPLRPVMQPSTDTRRPVRLYATLGAIAAAVTLMVGGAIHSALTSVPGTPVEWHERFVANSYDLTEAPAPFPVARWIGAEPDLSVAHLWLVDVARSEDDGFYLHYSGANNCRLTFGGHAVQPELPDSSQGLLTHGWSVGGLYYSLVAVGMDSGRFGAIAALLEEKTRIEHAADSTVLALRDATQSAVPCA